MKKMLAIAATLSALAVSQFALAQAPAPAAPATNDCEAKAIDKNGKPLHGAAKTAKMKKCVAGGGTAPAAPAAASAPSAAAAGCAEKAVSKAGKPLAGAVKANFMKKCEADAKAAK